MVSSTVTEDPLLRVRTLKLKIRIAKQHVCIHLHTKHGITRLEEHVYRLALTTARCGSRGSSNIFMSLDTPSRTHTRPRRARRSLDGGVHKLDHATLDPYSIGLGH